MSKLSERLQEYMAERSLTQLALADITGISHTNISDFLSGKHLPSYENLMRLLYAFHCSADYLLGKTDIPSNEPLHPVLPFHTRLRELMKDSNVSGERLKRELPVSGSVLFKWLSGKSLPSTESLLRLADYLGCSVDYLLGRTR